MTDKNVTKTYVYESIEVKLTGRSAIRTLKNKKVDTRVEITPASSEEGSWKKWVRQLELYEISK